MCPGLLSAQGGCGHQGSMGTVIPYSKLFGKTLAEPTGLLLAEEQKEGLRAGSRIKLAHTCSEALGAEFQGFRENNYNNLLFAELTKCQFLC